MSKQFHPAMIKRGMHLLLWGSCVAWGTAASAEEAPAAAYPHAETAATAQRLAAGLDQSLAPFSPAIPALTGLRGQVAIENTLGNILRALDAYPLAEAHWRRAQQAALASGSDATVADRSRRPGARSTQESSTGTGDLDAR